MHIFTIPQKGSTNKLLYFRKSPDGGVFNY